MGLLRRAGRLRMGGPRPAFRPGAAYPMKADARAAFRAGGMRPANGFALAAFCLWALAACERDFATPWSANGPDTTLVSVDPGKPDPGPDTAGTGPDSQPPVVKPPPVLIRSLSAPDLRLGLGETRPLTVTVLPPDATSPLYEATSGDPDVAEVTPDGVRGKSLGSATVTLNALDGSGKTSRLKVTVELIRLPCLLGSCDCGYGEKGKGKGKGMEDGCE